MFLAGGLDCLDGIEAFPTHDNGEAVWRPDDPGLFNV